MCLEEKLACLLGYLEEKGLLAEDVDGSAREGPVAAYLDGYMAEIKRKVDRYRRRLRREE
jgi:hypothetical protein